MADPAPPSTVCRHISGLSLNEARRKAPLIRRPLVNVTIGDLELGTNVQPYNSVQIKNTLEFEVLDRRGSREGGKSSLPEQSTLQPPGGLVGYHCSRLLGQCPFEGCFLLGVFPLTVQSRTLWFGILALWWIKKADSLCPTTKGRDEALLSTETKIPQNLFPASQNCPKSRKCVAYITKLSPILNICKKFYQIWKTKSARYIFQHAHVITDPYNQSTSTNPITS